MAVVELLIDKRKVLGVLPVRNKKKNIKIRKKYCFCWKKGIKFIY